MRAVWSTPRGIQCERNARYRPWLRRLGGGAGSGTSGLKSRIYQGFSEEVGLLGCKFKKK